MIKLSLCVVHFVAFGTSSSPSATNRVNRCKARDERPENCVLVVAQSLLQLDNDNVHTIDHIGTTTNLEKIRELEQNKFTSRC